jgi:hypothetical protein
MERSLAMKCLPSTKADRRYTRGLGLTMFLYLIFMFLAQKNAVYVQAAQDKGDYAEAAVLDSLGHVLTTIDRAPPEAPHSLLWFRLEINTDGLLLDMRILRQNDDRQ